jgi:uncharacterized protein YceH (UPF0502 family)
MEQADWRLPISICTFDYTRSARRRHFPRRRSMLKAMTLTPAEARVLGSLIEKGITTPDQYPLSLNSLRLACNQSSSREPVMTLDEDEIRMALNSLERQGLAAPNRDSRVSKYEENARHRLQLRRDEVAVICLLLLRGPQTPGELRSRADRLYTFDDTAAVLSTLERLSRREASDEHPDGALTVQHPRQPGSREARWATTLTGETVPASSHATASSEPTYSPTGAVHAAPSSATTGAITALAEELAAVRAELNELRTRLDRLESRECE